MEPDDWREFAGLRAFVLCDIEGGEATLLDPAESPALCGFDLLVEVHPEAGVSPEDFAARFEPSHEVRWIHAGDRDPSAFPPLAALAPLDRMLALVERVTPTPWLHLRARRLNP